MRCEEAREYIQDHIAGELASSTERLLSEHLDECDLCRTESHDLRRLWSDLEEIPPFKPRYEVMRAKFEGAMKDMTYPTPATSLRWTTKPFAVIFAALAIAAVAAVLLNRQANLPQPLSLSVPPAEVGSGGGRVRGVDTAAITLVEYGDYECPPCGFYYPVIKELLQRYPDKVRLEFHHFPLTRIHRNAVLAAVAAEAAGDQGRYWEMHDELLRSQKDWAGKTNAEAEFMAMASRLHLDPDRFARSMKDSRTEARVMEDIARGQAAGVSGTPTFFLNGQKLQDPPTTVDGFAALIDSRIQARGK